MLTPLFANSTTETTGTDHNMIMQFLPFIAIFVIMYFLVIRPQKNKTKQQQEMISKLKKGDQVLTSSGIFGKIYKISEAPEIELEVAEGVRMKMLKSLIVDTIASSSAVAENVIERKETKKATPEVKAKTKRVVAKKEKDA